MKLGLDSYSTRNSGLDPVGVLTLADDLGLDGVLFELTPFESLADEALAAVKQAADQRGLYLEFGMGSIYRWHPMAEKGRGLLEAAGYDVDVPDSQIVIHHLGIAEKLGSPLLRCVAGDLFTRDEGHDMAQLADDAVSILKPACRAAEEMGLKIAIENHADFTVRELASILARVGSPALGVTVDCGNLAFDLDDPLRLAEILAPYALTTHYKNYRIVRTTAGLALGNCALDEGDIDVLAIARRLAADNPQINLNLEIHSQFAPFRLDILDARYFRRHPPPPGDGLAWHLAKSWRQPVPADEAVGLPDGEAAWQLEYEHLRRSAAWARENLSDLLSPQQGATT